MTRSARTAAPARKAATPARAVKAAKAVKAVKAAKATKASSPRQAAPRPAEAGDVAPRATPAGRQAHATQKGLARAQARQAEVVKDALAQGPANGSSSHELVSQVRALVNGASPDDVRDVSALLTMSPEHTLSLLHDIDD